VGIEDDFRAVIENAVIRAAEKAGQEEIMRILESGKLGEAIAASAPEIGSSVADGLAERTPSLIIERRANEAGIAEMIRQAYGPGLDLCESVLRSAHEIGEEYVDLSIPEGKDGVPILRWVLGHLRARSCRIAEEALPSRLRSEPPSPVETAANEHNRDGQTEPDKGCGSQVCKAEDS
jgi:hypothetical protein